MVEVNGNRKTRVGILLENNFEDSEFKIPYTALEQAKAETVIIGSRMNDEYSGKRKKVSVKPEATATEVRCEDFDMILIPGGGAPDKIRANPNAVRLVMNAMAQGKLIAAVCHGLQVLIEADQLRGKQATGFRAIRKDIENAGATYIDQPLVVDGNLITSRQPSDLPIFTTAILTRLGLSIENTVLPDISDGPAGHGLQGYRLFEWWKLGEAWGGSTRNEIVKALNTAITGEYYTSEAFKQYAEKTSDLEIRTLLREITEAKKRHIELLKARLNVFGETVSWQEIGSQALATLQTWLNSSNDRDILRRALGDLQTGVVDSYHLCSEITDPLTVEIFTEIESNLSVFEQRFADLYRARLENNLEPPMPTTIAAVS